MASVSLRHWPAYFLRWDFSVNPEFADSARATSSEFQASSCLHPWHWDYRSVTLHTALYVDAGNLKSGGPAPLPASPQTQFVYFPLVFQTRVAESSGQLLFNLNM